MLEITPKNTATEAEKATDTHFVGLIHELVADTAIDVSVKQTLQLALELAQQEQQRRAAAHEPFKSLKTIIAEYLFEDPGLYQDPTGEQDRVVESRSLAALLKAAEKAQLDSLTGIYNRRKVDETLNQWLKTNRESEKQLEFAVILIDVDNFKKLNDTFGHPFGDEVLRKIAELLVHTFRRTDVVGRWGGEEFVVLMQATAADVQEKLNKLWQSLQSELQVSKPLQVTASIGWTMHTPGNSDTAESLTKAADTAMYQAKHQGRNQVVKFEETI